MNGILCPQCESKLDSGKLTKTDVVSIVKDIRGIELAVEFERK